MIRISWLTRLVFATVFIAAFGEASLAAATPDATVTGQVLVKAGGNPVAGTLVSIVAPGEPRKVVQTTRTDADGHYAFTHIPELGMMYVVQLEEQIRDQSIANEDVFVDLTKLADSGVIKTAPTLYTQLTPVSGQVIDVDTGKPVAGVGLGFSTIDNNGSGVTTDEHGTYRLNVRPREIHIVCRGTHDRYYPDPA
jgi:5-hydroxyisourate hydrolase-like protein (transthyretin family)